ncbi:rhodanese-like domain-containing protein [Chloroflexota bacterium]
MSSKNSMLSALTVLLIAGVTWIGGCVTETPNQEALTQVTKNIAPQEAFTLIQENQNNPDFVILDVRTPEEFADGHIANSINVDFYSETFRDDINKLDKDKTYLIYCRSGNRSGKALNIMVGLGFMEAYNISGGIIEWKAEGLPIIK